MRALIALSGEPVDEDLAAAAARVLDPARDQIIALHVIRPGETHSTYARIEATDTAARYADPAAQTLDRPLRAPAEGSEQAVERLHAAFEGHVSGLASRFLDGFSVDIQVRIADDAADAILAVADELDVQGIGIGARTGQSRVGAALLGSAAAEVMRRAQVPVLVVKQGTIANG